MSDGEDVAGTPNRECPEIPWVARPFDGALKALEAAQERRNHDDNERGREDDSRRHGNHVDGVGADPAQNHLPALHLDYFSFHLTFMWRVQAQGQVIAITLAGVFARPDTDRKTGRNTVLDGYTGTHRSV
jgi:hypothetical protein